MLPLILLAAVMAAHAGHDLDIWSLTSHPWLATSLWLGLPGLFVILAGCWFQRCAEAILGGQRERLPSASRILRGARGLLVLSALLFVLVFDGLSVIRQWTGNLILVDELLVLAPVLIGYFLLAFFWYSIDLAISKSSGESSGMTTRWSYAWNKLVIQVLLLFVPAAAILASIEFLGTFDEESIGEDLRQGLLLVITGTIFIGTPLIMRSMLSLTPLEPGELRDRLEQVCLRQRVPVREILSWNAGGSLVNAAVVGMLGRLRYILLTEGMIRWMLPEPYLLRLSWPTRSAMPAVGICPGCSCSIVAIVLVPWRRSGVPLPIPMILICRGHWLRLAMLLVDHALAGVFGWVSRRFEWQADACRGPGFESWPRNPPQHHDRWKPSTTMIGALPVHFGPQW